MPQRERSPRKYERTLPPHREDERALGRIYFHRSDLDQLNWYLRLTHEDLSQLSSAEHGLLREEVKAVERTLVRRLMGAANLPDRSDAEIRDFQATFREKFRELADTSAVLLGPFETLGYIAFGFWGEEVTGGKWLEYHFWQLLKKYPEAVQRCPYCKNIFVRPRKNALYCSRECQNRAAMKKLRQRKSQEALKLRRDQRRQRGGKR